MAKIALLSPGAMGASVGAAASDNGHYVTWLDQNRSRRTRARAERAGLKSVTDEEQFFRDADIVLSICPPHLAEGVVAQATDHGFRGLYVEANAIAPAKMRQIDSRLQHSDIACVDGSIIGGPAWEATSQTVLYLSGHNAQRVSDLFEDSVLKTRITGDTIGQASALKMTFAAYSKGSIALLAAILATAQQEGVLELLHHQWGESFSEQTTRRVTGSAEKAWRFAGEMQEIATTFESAGLPKGFHQAAADTFSKLDVFKDAKAPPELAELLRALTKS